MPVLTGVLLDVSESFQQDMQRIAPKASSGYGAEESNSGSGIWARSIFKVVDDLIKKDVMESNHVFALGVGASSSQPEVFDLLNTLKNVKTSQIGSKCRVDQKAVMAVHEAREILHVEQRHLSYVTPGELFAPFVGWNADKPLWEAFYKAKDLFALPEYEDHQKVLFILSNGRENDEIMFENTWSFFDVGFSNPTDEPLMNVLIRRIFSEHDITFVSCFLGDHAQCHELELYSKEAKVWKEPAKFMFRLSSAVKTALIPQSIYSARGWKIDSASDETKLFFLVNHPNLIQGVCEIVRDVLSFQDALANVPGSDCIDSYLNDSTGFFIPQEQHGGTCYANASALVLHLAMKRIVMRVGGHPTFLEIRKKLIEGFGRDGAKIHKVLKKVCPQYRLHFQEVNAVGAERAVAAKRPVIARFYLTKKEWTSFNEFYRGNKRGILTTSEIDISKRPPGAKTTGHAVVLTSCDCDGLRLMNSWGSTWADKGFFRVKDADVLGLQFTDVFWTLDDLKPEEKDEYIRRGLEMIKQLKVQTRVQVEGTKYLCPSCLKKPKVKDFTDRFLQIECLTCGSFKKIW